MKLRRFFSLLLTLALLCALTVPALAAGTSYEDFLADFDRWWAERFPGMTLEEYQQNYDYTIYTKDELMRGILYEQWKFEMWVPDYLAANPSVWEELRANAYDYFGSHPYYSLMFRSPQDYMAKEGITEEQFRDSMASLQLTKLYNEYAFLTEHGGVPGQLNVMVNGTCLAFPADRPAYLKNCVTYVDAKTLSQALGAEVAADETGYAPLRAAAEALGCDVFWDSTYGMAVVLDPAAIAAEIDKDFTLYNRVYTNGYDGNWTLSGTAKADFTLFDTITGNKTASGSGSADLVISEGGFSGTVRYDLDKMIQSGFPKPALLPAKDTVELRVDTRENVLWFHAPALNEALAGNGANITRDGWLSLSVEELLDGLLLIDQFLLQNKTMGERICALFADGTVTTTPACEYDLIMNIAHNWTENMGDAQFTRKGDAYTLTPEMHTGFSPISDLYWLKVSQQDLTLTLKDNGDAEIDARMRLAWDGYDYSLGDVAEVTCRSSRRGNKVEAVIVVHARNLFELTVTLDLTAKATDRAPELAPPEGAELVDMEGLYGG